MGRTDEKRKGERRTTLGAAMHQDVREMLFRFAESAEGHDGRSALVRRAIRVAMRASTLETRVLGSHRVYDELRVVAVAWAHFRAERLARILEIDREDARDLGRIQDWEDRLLGVTGHWTVESKRCATKHETACPYADLAASDTRICTDLVHALETETFTKLVPGYRLVPLGRLLSRGDGVCEFRHELGATASVEHERERDVNASK